MGELFSRKYLFLSLIVLCLISYFSLSVSADENVKVSAADSPCFMGHKVSIPVKLDNADGVAGFQFTINFDTSLLTKPEVFKGNLICGDANWRIETNVASGQITIIGYNAISEGLLVDNGALVKLSFKVADNIPVGTKIDLHISECTLSDSDAQSIPSITEDGSISVLKGKKCDVNGDNTVNILDVVRTVNFALDKAVPTDIERYTADANDDGSINIIDVVQTVNVALGRIQEEPLPQGDKYKDCFIRDLKWNLDHFEIKVEQRGLDEFDYGWYDLSQDCKLKGAGIVPGLENTIVDIIYDEEKEEITYVEVTSKTLIQSGDKWEYDTSNNRYEINGVKFNIAQDYQGTIITTFDNTKWYKAFIDRKGEIWQVRQRSTTTPALVDEYKPQTKKLTMKYSGDFSPSYNLLDQDVFVERDGQYAQLSDIMVNDVVYIWDECYGFDYYIEAYSLKQSGTVEAFYGGITPQLKISGVKYAVAANNRMSRDGGTEYNENIELSGLEDVFGKQVQYILNKSNQIVYLISDVDLEENIKYGVITEIAANNVNKKIEKITVLNKNRIEESFDIDTEEVELIYPSNIGSNNNELDVDDFVKFVVNENNVIQSITILAYWDSNEVTSGVKDPIAVGSTSVKANYADAENCGYHGQITGGDTSNDRIKFNGIWYNFTNATVVFNANLDQALGEDDDEADIECNEDFVEWAQGLEGAVSVYVQYEGSEVKYVFLHSEVAASDGDYAVVLDTYVNDGDKWVDVDIKGEIKEYELMNSNYPVEGGLYEYTVSNNKFVSQMIVFNPEAFRNGAVLETKGHGSVAGKVYAQVTDIKTSTRGVEINDVWYYADENTIIYDYSDWYDDGDDPVFFSDVADINEDDYIIFIDNGDNENVAEMFIIVNNVDE